MALIAAWLAVPIILDLSPVVVCPGKPELTEAFGRQGIETSDAAHARAVLRLEAADGGVRLALGAVDGPDLLVRSLPQSSQSDCAALADTIALIVERRIRELGWAQQAVVSRPATVAPVEVTSTVTQRATIVRRPRRMLELRAGALVADDLDATRPTLGPSLGVRVRPWQVLEAGLSLGWIRHEGAVATGALTVDEIPATLDVGSVIAHSRWEIAARGRVELATVTASSRDLTRTERTLGLSARIGPAVGGSVRLWRAWWLSLEGGAGLRVFGYRLTVEGVGQVAEQRTVALSASLSLGTRWKF